MAQRQSPGVQCLPRQHQGIVVTARGFSCQSAAMNFSVASVQAIAQDRRSDVIEMNSDLVSAARFGQDSHLGEASVSREDFVKSRRWFAGGVTGSNRLFVALVGVPPDRRVDDVSVAVDRPGGDRQVLFLDLALVELLGQVHVDRIGFGDHDHAAGVAIESVDDTRPGGPADVGESLKAEGERAGERARPIAAGRMDHHAGRFVDHHEPVVFVEYIERDVFRDRLVGRWWRKPEADPLSLTQLVTGPDHLAFNLAPFALNRVANLRPRITVAGLCQEQVDPLARGRLGDDKFAIDRFVGTLFTGSPTAGQPPGRWRRSFIREGLGSGHEASSSSATSESASSSAAVSESAVSESGVSESAASGSSVAS